jgi:immune inhibitor A
VEPLEDKGDHSIVLNDVKGNVTNTINANRFSSVHKLWANGYTNGNEYFLVENRTKSGYDASLPGEGLLSKLIARPYLSPILTGCSVWHIDEAVQNNSDSLPHYKVALMNADGASRLNGDGDDTNPFPGRLGKRNFTGSTFPNSRSYAGQDTFVAVRNISDAGRAMKMDIAVKPQTNNPGQTSKL